MKGEKLIDMFGPDEGDPDEAAAEQKQPAARAAVHSCTILLITLNLGRILQHFQKGICQQKAGQETKERSAANTRVKL